MTKRQSRQNETFSDQLRRIIAQSEMSRNQLCNAAGLDPSHLHRFFHGTGKLTNETIDRLVSVLGLRLVVDGKKGK
jgi:plasmid maintenance system antidote protein VapI